MTRMLPTAKEIFLPKKDDAIMPTRAYRGDAGYDLYARKAYVVNPGDVARIETGIAIAFPEDTWGYITDRSSFFLKGLIVGGGVIDERYMDDVCVLMANIGRAPFVITPGMKVGQIILLPRMVAPEEMGLPERGVKKHGSSDGVCAACLAGTCTHPCHTMTCNHDWHR